MSREAPLSPTACRGAEDASHLAIEENFTAPPDLKVKNSSMPPLGTAKDDADNRYSNAADEVEDGMLWNEQSVTSRETVWGSPCVLEGAVGVGCSEFSRGHSSSESVKRERESIQLNKKNLYQMEKDLSDGKATLHPELLDDDTFCVKRRRSRGKHVGIASVASEVEEGARGCFVTSDVEQSSPHLKFNKSKNKFFDISVCSVESVCGSDVWPDILSRKNLDRFASQLSMGVKELTPEVLLSNNIQKLHGNSTTATNDGRASICAEVGSEMRDDMRSQDDATAKTLDAAREQSQYGGASECSSRQTLLDGALQFKRENNDDPLRPIASKTRELNGDVVTELSSTMFPDSKTSVSMMVGPRSPCSRLDDMPREDTMSDGSSKAERCGDNVPKESNTEVIQELRQSIANNVQATQELKSGQDKVIAEMNGSQCGSRSHLVDLTKQPGSSKKQTSGLQTVLDANLGELKTQVLQREGEWPQLVFSELKTLKQKLEYELQELKAHYEAEMGTLRQHVTECVGHVKQLASELIIKLNWLQRPEFTADKFETFPPGDPLPEGEKIHLVVDIQCSTENREVLLPISVNATVGMCKCEILRRIYRQGLIGNDVCYSNVILLQDTRTLYEEDILGDVLVSGLPNTGALQKLVKLTLRSTHQNQVRSPRPTEGEIRVPTRSSTAPQNAASSNSFLPAASLATNGADTQAAVTIREGTSYSHQTISATRQLAPMALTKSEDRRILCVESVDEISESESLYRRLLIELERSEREALVREEKAHCVVVVKEGLTRIRISLLDRATYTSVEVHRCVACSALEKLDAALAPGATLEEMNLASNTAQAALQSISFTPGEDSRVAAMQEVMRRAQDGKQRTVEGIKELCDKITHRLRIPSNMLKRAESLTQDAQRALILAPSLTQKELDEVHESLADFYDAVCH
ncbi:hypothetical protein TraAM80_08506 [Trypanosoma rangeli]|uniref:Uncharacterized protein n=1 Tax=Trypanosoma rangeli TaxID=5698 RepID=A0A422N0E8_TRYRA|nr:uncharacterized protein TraAM80_08506 [Trypanosoma rangeli]RNE98932.1 hypothetical protein TraAM80_08506 [Trypanosoma rangeli]|eukprot:RNE98932.1 hypothetical protein TraAM80_08506 [Trypanosoma rangeli]